MSAHWLVQKMATNALDRAEYCEQEARRLRVLARTLLEPPYGVRIEFDGRDTIRFVGSPEAMAQLELAAPEQTP